MSAGIIQKGINYSISNRQAIADKGKGVLIYDVLSYFGASNGIHEGVEIQKVKQYPGYLVKLQDFDNFDAYLVGTFDGKSRNKLRSYKKRLENNIDIHYKMYFGEISKATCHNIFESFKKLLKIRFENKKV